jgi:hypothetical protein
MEQHNQTKELEELSKQLEREEMAILMRLN